MKLFFTPRARRQIERARHWWEQNREEAPGLFMQELAEAEEHILTAPGAGELWGIRKRQVIRRALLPKTEHHIYYVHDRQRAAVIVLALWGSRRERTPKL